jgi:3-oxoacyl-[acyl-carrier-protein] synthase II
MGSCGVIETIIALCMMEQGFLPPTLNLEKIDDRCAMIRHVTQVQEAAIHIAGIENFAFGGVNTMLFLKKYDE